MLLFYVRHGDPIYRPDSLTELGHQQAKALVQRMKECKPERLFASSSERAILTAKPTAEFLNKEIEILDWCNEDYTWNEFTVVGENGRKHWCFDDAAVKRQFNSDEVRQLGKKWYDHPAFKDTLYKEGTERIRQKADEFMLSLGYMHDEKNNGYIPIKSNDDRVALFAHAGFGLVFLSTILDIPLPMFATRFAMSHSNITVIDFSGDDFIIPKALQVSNDSHLFAEGISTDYNNWLHF